LRRGLERSIGAYRFFAAALAFHAWMPIFFLYFSRKLTIDQVLALEAIYYTAVVVLEVPSGYLADAIGRRATLLLASLALTLAHGLFIVADTFAVFAAAQLMLALGFACASGADTAYHYDVLAALDREHEYGPREARVSRARFVAAAAAGVTGGALGSIDLRLAYAATGVASLMALGACLLVMRTPPHSDDQPPVQLHPVHFVGQLLRCVGLLRHPTLAWMAAFAILMTVMNHVPYTFYQPYLDLLGRDLTLPTDRTTPVVAGLHMAVTMLIAAPLAGYSIRLARRLGAAPFLLLTAMLQLTLILATAAFLHPLIAVLLLARSAPRALMEAPLNEAVTPRVPRTQRATYLSLQSLAGRLAFAGLLLALAPLGYGQDQLDHPTLARMLYLAAGPGAVVVLALLLTRRVVTTPQQERTPAATSSHS
jgi:MFS family permease